jgi:hypothetical protein
MKTKTQMRRRQRRRRRTKRTKKTKKKSVLKAAQRRLSSRAQSDAI